MKTIIVGFSRPIKPTIFSRAIQWSEGTNYDHVYIKWNWASVDRDVIYQASKLAVNFESNTTFDAYSVTIEEYELSVDDEIYKEIMQFCIDNSNKPYSVLEIVGFTYVAICAMLKQQVHNPFPTHAASFVCSKLIDNILLIAKVTDIRVSSDDVTPLMLNQMIKAAGLKRIT
jgi:hypothetical protein